MFKSISAFGLALCAGTMLAVSSPASAQDARVYVVDDAVKISPDGKPLSIAKLDDYSSSNAAWDGKRISLSGAKGEYVAFQVMTGAGADALSGVDVNVSDLKSADGKSIPAGDTTRFREWYIKVTRPSTSPHGSAGIGDYPDALIPADAPKDGLPVDVPVGKTQGIWVDVHIPRDAAPGKYEATVKAVAGGHDLATLPLSLEVYDFAIPVQRHLAWKIGYTGFEEIANHYHIPLDSDEYLKMERALYKVCYDECRFVPTTHYNTPRLPSHGTGENFAFDWTAYDKRFGPYLDGSAFEDHEPVNIFSLPVNTMQGYPTGGLTLDKVDEKLLEAACKDMVKHWAEKHWNINTGFVYVADEPGPPGYAAIEKECDTIHKADPHILTSVAFYTHFGDDAPNLVKEFENHVTMWDIAGDYMNLPALLDRQKAGDNVGFYQGSEPFEGSEALDSDGVALTTWPWIAWKYNLNHLFLYNMCEWDYFRLDRGEGRNKPWAKLPREIWENPLNQSWQTNSQGVLIYPGQYVGVRGAVTSIRMKEIRRGMQDYEYFWMLSQNGQKDKADEIATRIINKALYETGTKFGDGANGKWERDPRKWADARKEMAQLIAKKQ